MNVEPVSLSTVLQAIMIACVLWVIRTSMKNEKSLVRLETILTGANGNNGVVGEIRKLRERQHVITNEVQAERGERALLDQRVGQIEEARA